MPISSLYSPSKDSLVLSQDSIERLRDLRLPTSKPSNELTDSPSFTEPTQLIYPPSPWWIPFHVYIAEYRLLAIVTNLLIYLPLPKNYLPLQTGCVYLNRLRIVVICSFNFIRLIAEPILYQKNSKFSLVRNSIKILKHVNRLFSQGLIDKTLWNKVIFKTLVDCSTPIWLFNFKLELPHEETEPGTQNKKLVYREIDVRTLPD